jgi:hypothetical protein
MARPINPNYGIAEGLFIVDPSSPRVDKIKKVYEEYNKILERDFKKQNLVNTPAFRTWVEKKYGVPFRKNIDDFVFRLKQKGFDPVKDAGLIKPNLSKKKYELLENLIAKANLNPRPTPIQSVLGKVFKATTLSLQSDEVKNIMSNLDTLQDKVNKAFDEIIEADEVLVKKTKGGRGYREASPIIQRIADKIKYNTVPPVRDALENNPFYRENKPLIKFARDAALFDGERPISEIFDEAKYRIDGGVHWSQKMISKNPSESIYDFALRHWNNNKRIKAPSKIEFFNKKTNKPIEWDKVPIKSGGKSLNRNDVYFTFSEDSNNQKWTYDKIKQKGRESGLFDEVYESKQAYNDLLNKSVTNPKTGKKTNFGNLMRETFAEGYGYGAKVNPYGIDHITGVSNDPFKNLRVVSHRDNLALDWINRRIPQKNFRNLLVSELMPKTKNLKGLEYITEIEKGGMKLAENVLTKGKTFSQTPIQELAENIVRNEDVLNTLTKPQLNKLKSTLSKSTSALNFIKKQSPRAAAILLPVTLLSGITDEFGRMGMSQAQASEIQLDQKTPLSADIEFGDPETWDKKVLDFVKEYPVISGTAAGTTAIGGALTTKTGRKALGTLGRTLITTPIGAAAINLGVGIDPKETLDRVFLEAELAAAPGLVKGAQAMTKNPLLQRLLTLGIGPRVAAGLSGVGIAALAGEGLYELGKRGVAEYEKLQSMTPEEKEEYLRTEVQPLMEETTLPEDYAMGGRVGLKDGSKPPKMDRRMFMKIMAGIMSLPVIGKVGKVAKPTVKALAKEAQAIKIPPYFFKLVDKIKNLGEDVTKRLSTQEREVVYNYRTPDADYELIEDLNTGDKRIKILKGDPDFPGYKEEELTLTKGRSDETTGRLSDEYDEYTVRSDFEGKMKDIDEGIEDIGDLVEEVGVENVSLKDLQDAGYDVDRLPYELRKKLGIK